MRPIVESLGQHLASAACIGSISEIFDAEAPYTPRGCCAQAWSIAEVLRLLVVIGPALSGQEPHSEALALFRWVSGFHLTRLSYVRATSSHDAWTPNLWLTALVYRTSSSCQRLRPPTDTHVLDYAGGVDQSQVRETLRKIPDLPAGDRVVLLGQ